MQVRLAEIWDIAIDTGQHPKDIHYADAAAAIMLSTTCHCH
jgi:hypothetical protein